MFFIWIVVCFISIYILLLVANLVVKEVYQKSYDSFFPADQYVMVGGIKTHFFYKKAQNKNSHSKNLVFLHSFGGSLLVWKPIMMLLSQNHSIYSLDLRGFGFSQKFYDDKYTFADLGKHVISFIEHFYIENPVIIGHSMGGGVALYVAMHYVQTEALVLVDAASHYEPHFLAKVMKLPIFDIFFECAINLISISFLFKKITLFSFLFKKKKLFAADFFERYLLPYRVKGTGRLFRSLLNVRPSLYDNDQFAKIKCPVLLIWGENDTIISIAEAQLLQKKLTRSNLITYDHAGHLVFEEFPNRFVHDIQSFLTSIN